MVLAGSPFSAGSTSSAFNNFPTMLRTAKTTLLANGNTTFVVNPVTGTVTPGTSIFDFARSDLLEGIGRFQDEIDFIHRELAQTE